MKVWTLIVQKYSDFVSSTLHREQHSTETALMNVQHDIVHNLDSGHCVVLVLLDTSAAFDTINIDMLLNTLHLRFGIGSTALDWFKSDLTGRSQRVAIGSSSSTATPVHYGVTQGSVLGPVLFNVYTTPIADICKKHQVHCHRFADDIQLYVSYNPAESEKLNFAKIHLIQWRGRDQSLNCDTSTETERQQHRVHGAAIIPQPTRVRQPNLHTNYIISRCTTLQYNHNI